MRKTSVYLSDELKEALAVLLEKEGYIIGFTVTDNPVGPGKFLNIDMKYSEERRRVISGILHVLRTGCRWRDVPEAYGPPTTIYNRFNRWSRQGLWLGMFEALTGHTGIYGASIDATHVRAHRSAAGAKGGPSSKP